MWPSARLCTSITTGRSTTSAFDPTLITVPEWPLGPTSWQIVSVSDMREPLKPVFCVVLGDGELWTSKPNDLMTQLSEQRTFRSGELERRLSRLVA
jgi:hypothetical protein